MKKFLKILIPNWVKNRFRSQIDHLRLLYMEKSLSKVEFKNISLSKSSALIVPSDRETPFASLGDDAMITTIQQQCSKHGVSEIHILVADEVAASKVRERGLSPHIGWNSDQFESSLKTIAGSVRPKFVFVVGADVLDGHYGVLDAGKMILAGRFFARLGSLVSVLGFSLNASPNQLLCKLMNSSPENMIYHPRDVYSTKRFSDNVTASHVMVADSAFLLEPSSVPPECQSWIQKEREEGRKVLALNLNPMVLPLVNNSLDPDLSHRISAELMRLASLHNVSWLLLPHDYREVMGDNCALLPIYKDFQKSQFTKCYYFSDQVTTKEIKAIASDVDGVITGRMHLSIAALGSGVPAFCITYQDKFEGLFAHFSLPSSLLISPERFVNAEAFGALVDSFIVNLDSYTSAVESSLQAVRSLSAENFRILSDNTSVN